MFSLARAATILVGLALTPVPTSATTLIGDVISGSYNAPCDTCVITQPYGGFSYFTNPFVVTEPAAETTLFVGNPVFYEAWSVYFNRNSLTLTSAPAPSPPVFHSGYPFIGPVFTVLSGNTFGYVTNVTESLPCTPCNPITAYVSGNSLFINWTGAGAGQVGDTITVDFTVGGPVSAVPEPSTWMLMLTGLAFLGFAGYRGRENNTGVLTEA
jgi:hypothetical protein